MCNDFDLKLVEIEILLYMSVWNIQRISNLILILNLVRCSNMMEETILGYSFLNLINIP